MARHRYLLKGPDAEELKERAVSEYGRQVTFVRCSRVVSTGLVGLLSKPYYELLVEVVEEPTPDTAPLPVLGGIVNLLVDPPPAETEPTKPPAVSTASGEFNNLIQDLTEGIGADRAARRRRGTTTRKVAD